MNRKMYQICQDLAGRDIQNITELKEALEHPLKENVFYDVDLKVYCFADGSVWKFSEKEIATTAGDRFFQFLASEVSELYRNKVLLKEENQKLQEMSVAMKELSKNVITLTREEEMLSMKMRVHDNLGYSVLAAQRMLLRESEADRDVFLSQWKQTLDLLNKDNESVEGEQLPVRKNLAKGFSERSWCFKSPSVHRPSTGYALWQLLSCDRVRSAPLFTFTSNRRPLHSRGTLCRNEQHSGC